jgi:SAM-dependent methyltransferase
MSVGCSTLTPSGPLEARIRYLLARQLGGVLPPVPARGLEWYYDEVVLGARALDAFKVLLHYRGGGGQPVLDIGCGLGTFVVPADSHSMPAVGLEPNLRELALARERATAAGSGPRFVVGTGEALPFEDNSFSALLLHDVLEHVSDWRSVLRECRRVLTPGGWRTSRGPVTPFASSSLTIACPGFPSFLGPSLVGTCPRWGATSATWSTSATDGEGRY